MSKKAKYIGLSAIFGICAFGFGVLTIPQTKKVNAATLSGTVFEETFSSKTLSDKWIKNDFSIGEGSYYSMRFDNQTSYGAAMLYTDYEIHDDCTISFDFRQSNVNAENASANWFGVLFGYDDDSAHFTGGNAVLLSYGKSLTQLMDDGDGKSEKLVATSYNDHSKYSTSFLADATDKTYTVELVLTYTGTRYSDGESLYRVDAYYYEKTGERPLVPKYTYKSIAADGYFGFSAMASAVLDISDLKITEGDQTVVSENFQKTDGTGKNLLATADGSGWKGCNLSEANVYSYFNGRIDAANKADGLLLSNYELISDTENEKLFEISFDAQIDELPENGAFGVAMGLTKNAVSASEGSFIGVQGIDDEGFCFVHIVNGKLSAKTERISKKLYGDGNVTVRIVGYYNGNVEASFCGYTASFENAACDGFVGLATLGENACNVYFDTFRIVKSEYISATAPNHAIDFTGVKETIEDDFTYLERYVNERVWFLGQGVAFQKVYKEDATFIQFTDSNERTFFGAKQTYSDFICRFSVTVTQNRADCKGAYIGLSFGKENRNDRAVDCPSVLFGMTDDGMILQGKNCTISGGDENGLVKQYETYPELDFWSAEDYTKTLVTYRVMVIVRGGVGYVYYANEADMSEMNVCKAVLTDMETNGYVTVSALGGATFRLNDFSVTNVAIDAKAETAGIGANAENCEYVNVNFVDETLYLSDGDVTKTSNGLSVGYDSHVKINEKYTDFFAYIDIRAVKGNGMEIALGENFIRLNADGGIYSDMKQIDGMRTFAANALQDGGVIMLQKTGKRISISLVDKNQPTVLLEQPIAVFESDRQDEWTEITISTISETLISLESVRLYSLNSTIAIERDDWDATDTALPEKNSPTGNAESGLNGCVASLENSYAALLLTLIVGALFIIKKGGVKNERL